MNRNSIRWLDRGMFARLAIAVMLLLCATLGQAWAIRYLESGPPPRAVALKKPLASFPHRLGSWHTIHPAGTAEEHFAERAEKEQTAPGSANHRLRAAALLQFATDRLRRDYRHEESGQRVAVWMAYSPDGADRQHHPEVCLSVAGQVEDPQGRGRLTVGTHAQPIRRYRFVDGQRGQWLFYWYYTLRPQPTDEAHSLRALYRRIRRRPASLTIEVFAPDTGETDLAGVQEFVAQLDAELQTYLPSFAVRGSQPLAVTVLRSNSP